VTSTDEFNSWTVTVSLNLGENILTVETQDSSGGVDSSAAQIQVSNEPFNTALFTGVVDEVNGQALFVDRDLNAIVSIDLLTKQRKVLSGPDVPSSSTLYHLGNIALDSDNNRLLVFESIRKKLLAFDLITGLRTDVTPDNNQLNAFAYSSGVALDTARNRVLIMEGQIFSFPNLVAIDLTTGVASIISGASVPDSNNLITSGSLFLVDHVHDRAIVVNNGIQGTNATLLAVDLASGGRTVFSAMGSPASSVEFGILRGIVVDYSHNRFVVVEDGPGGIQRTIAVDITSGERSLIGTSVSLDSNFLSRTPGTLDIPNTITLDETNNRLLSVTGLDIVESIDLTSGQPNIFSEISHVPDSEFPFSLLFNSAIDSTQNRLITLNANNSVIAVDLSSGIRSELINFSSQNSNLLVSGGISIHDGAAYFFIRDAVPVPSSLQLVRLDLMTNEIMLVSGESENLPGLDFIVPQSITIDQSNNRALFVDAKRIFAVDLSSGIREIFTLFDSGLQVGNSLAEFPFDHISFAIEVGASNLVVDDAHNRVLFLNIAGDLAALDLDAGVESVLSLSGDIAVNSSSGAFASIALDVINNRALITVENDIYSVDLDSGQRSLVSIDPRSEIAKGSSPKSLTIDPGSDRAFLSDFSLNAVFVIDLQTGERAIFSR